MSERELFIREVQKRIPTVRRTRKVLRSPTLAAGLMLLAAVVSIVIANTQLHEGFSAFWRTDVGFIIGPFVAEMSLAHVINDVLMAIFFLLIGLEIKYEMTVGELTNIRQAILPIVAAVGGVIVPVVIYLIFNASNPEGSRGWGIPAATDIAFALGIMALLGNRVPHGIKVFLSTLAVADDIIAILIIALFYGQSPELLWIGAAAIVLTVLIIMNKRHVYALAPYIIIGIVLWLCIFMSGIHSTIAGVLLAFTIPAGSRVNLKSFTSWSDEKIQEANGYLEHDVPLLGQKDYLRSITQLSSVTKQIIPPAIRLEKAIYPWVYFVILPLFALTNADVSLTEAGFAVVFSSPVFYGVALGLLLGKPIGIVFMSLIVVKTKIASLPDCVNWGHMIGAGILGGVGFTMAIFVANLAFVDPTMITIAKAAIMTASLLAGILGYIALRLQAKKATLRRVISLPDSDDIMPLNNADLEGIAADDAAAAKLSE